MSATSLKKEWEKVTEAFELTEDEKNWILQNSIEAAFADESVKDRLRKMIEKEFHFCS